MKAINRTTVVVFVTLFVMAPRLTVYAEPETPDESKATMNLFGWAHLEAEKGVHFVFDVSGSYGPMTGYTQTPLGGAPPSTSDKRPTFDELGIEMMTMINLSLSAGLDSHDIYGSAHLVNLRGTSTLDEELIFHGREYPAGTRVKSDIGMNWYDIGYQYNIYFDKERTNLRMAPTVVYTLWDFSTELESSSGRNSRGYIKGTPRLGLDFEWFPAKRFSISGKGIGSLPLNNMPHIYTVGLLGKYNLTEIIRLKISLFMGIEYDWIDFKDNQTVPNHVKANIGPLGLIGAEIKF